MSKGTGEFNAMNMCLGCSGLWDPITFEDVGKLQKRCVEMAVAGGEREHSGQRGQKTLGREGEEWNGALALGRESGEGGGCVERLLCWTVTSAH